MLEKIELKSIFVFYFPWIFILYFIFLSFSIFIDIGNFDQIVLDEGSRPTMVVIVLPLMALLPLFMMYFWYFHKWSLRLCGTGIYFLHIFFLTLILIISFWAFCIGLIAFISYFADLGIYSDNSLDVYLVYFLPIVFILYFVLGLIGGVVPGGKIIGIRDKIYNSGQRIFLFPFRYYDIFVLDKKGELIVDGLRLDLGKNRTYRIYSVKLTYSISMEVNMLGGKSLKCLLENFIVELRGIIGELNKGDDGEEVFLDPALLSTYELKALSYPEDSSIVLKLESTSIQKVCKSESFINE